MGERRFSELHLPPRAAIGHRPERADTMEAWERFLTGDPAAAIPAPQLRRRILAAQPAAGH